MPKHLFLPKGSREFEDDSPPQRKRHGSLSPIATGRTRTPYTGSSGSTSTAGSSPPPVALTLERERRQYAGTAANSSSSSSDVGERQRRQYVGTAASSSSDTGERQRRQYASTTASPSSDLGERQRRQYAGTTASSSSDMGERQRRQYAGTGASPSSDLGERQRRQYAGTGASPSSDLGERQRRQYAGPAANSSSDAGERQRANSNANNNANSGGYRDPTDRARFERDRRQYSGGATGHQSSLSDVERERPPYPNEDVSNSRLAPETGPRQSQPYSSVPHNAPPLETMPREPQPYSSTSSKPSRKSTQYAASSDIPYAREDLRPPQSPRVPPSATLGRPSPQPPESPRGYPSSPLHTAKSSESSTTTATRIDTPTPSEPSPTSSPQDSFGQSLVARPSTPQSEFLHFLPACPKRQLVSRGNWYAVPSIKGFNICEKCYEVHVFDSAFHGYFKQIKLAKGEKTFCAFNNPRVVEFVWPATVRASDFDIFADYARERAPMGACAGMRSPAKDGVWYKIRGRTRGVLACEACYQDVILASPFHHHFERMEATASPENAIPCHVAWPFVEARLLKKPSTFEEVERDINYRLTKVLACPEDKLIKAPGRRWWKPKGTALPIFICDCCYWDGIFPTAFDNEFSCVAQEDGDVWCCAMSCYQLSTVWQYAAEKKDLTPWLDAANAAWSPMCDARGSSSQVRIWNVFKDPDLDGFDFCERCADVFIRPLGFGNRLEQRRYDSNEIIKCDLNAANEYQRDIIQKLGEAAAWREFSILQEFLCRLGPRVYYPPCPGEQPAVRSQWWGCGDFMVCEECYQQRVRLASPCASRIRKFDLDGKTVSIKCDLGTDDWRYIWKKRCCEGRDFDRFMEALLLKHRLEELRHQRLELIDDMREKSRRRLHPEERRRMDRVLKDLEMDEQDTTNLLTVSTRM